ncbi:hypothetical protein HZB69_03185 [Candidatus Amesbacteria bacterium]|nr:hypothetical protein [Candidatus Amesbacteria bacterium]
MAPPVGSSILVSPTFAKWYSDIFMSLNIKGENYYHPHQLLTNFLALSKSKSLCGFKIKFTKNVFKITNLNILYTNDDSLASYLDSEKINSFDNYFESLAPVSSGSLFLDKGTSPRLIVINQSLSYVVVGVHGFEEYLTNYIKIKNCLSTELTIGVIGRIGAIKSNNGGYFISEYRGFDFESEIIENNRHELKDKLLEATSRLNKYFEENSLFVRNLAPRNMINGDGKIYLIDFDHVYDQRKIKPLTLITHMFSRRLWYSDVFEKDVINKLFPIKLDSGIETYSKCDGFEVKYFNSSKVKLKEKIRLYDLVEKFESKNVFKGCDIYGHQLGRFITDFWGNDLEIKLYKYLHDNLEKLDQVRAVLYLVSKIDQELLLRKKYGLSLISPILTPKVFEWIKNQNGEFQVCCDLFTYLSETSRFEAKYKHISELLI